MAQNPYLRFAVETLLRTANPKGEPYFRGTHFHKMIFLLYKRLKNKGIDIKLPYSWYHYGTFVDSTEFERQTGVSFSHYVPEDESTRAIDFVSFEGIPSDVAKITEREAYNLVKEFKENGYFKSDYLNTLLDIDYAYAPFDFQRIYNRGFIRNLNLLKSYNAGKEEVEIYLDHPDSVMQIL